MKATIGVRYDLETMKVLFMGMEFPLIREYTDGVGYSGLFYFKTYKIDGTPILHYISF